MPARIVKLVIQYTKLCCIIGSLLLSTNITFCQTTSFTVAADGSGDFTSVQAAVNAVPVNHQGYFVIKIKSGIYKERLAIPKSVSFVHFIGKDSSNTIITFDNYASKKDTSGKEFGTSGSSSIFVDGSNITFENICFENSAGAVGQAVAVNITGNQVAFKKCKFLGYQDTLYTKGGGAKLYFKNCFIAGTVDFIFGSSSALFEGCVLHSIGNGGYVTAASTTEGSKFGYVFLKCRLTNDAPANSVLLGRPWRPFAKVVFIECDMASHIKAEGWSNWGKVDNEKTVYYAEYKSTGKSTNVTARLPWSHQLTHEEAKLYTVTNFLESWQPF